MYCLIRVLEFRCKIIAREQGVSMKIASCIMSKDTFDLGYFLYPFDFELDEQLSLLQNEKKRSHN